MELSKGHNSNLLGKIAGFAGKTLRSVSNSIDSSKSERKENKHSLDSCREADDGEKESICVKIFKHALDRLSVYPEGDAGRSQVQTTAHHIFRSQDMLVQRRDSPRDAAYLGGKHTGV